MENEDVDLGNLLGGNKKNALEEFFSASEEEGAEATEEEATVTEE